MARNLLLVDHENVHKLDLSVLDESFRAIVFVGALQNPPKASRKQATAHRFARVEFRKIQGTGGNALDFHIACELGRIFETARDTVCIVLSRDKGFDPSLLHLNSSGLSCHRLDDMAAVVAQFCEVVCPRCKKSSTIEHHGGRWCTNCGRFASLTLRCCPQCSQATGPRRLLVCRLSRVECEPLVRLVP
jgi:PIN domain